ncbi:MAG: hypothetical protein GY757_05710 [bacterium]|nr:hypothetical protein [bacterium]
MNNIKVVPIENTKKNIKTFVKLAWKIYKDNEFWPSPIIADQVKFIHNGPYHEVGVMQPFLAFLDDELVGRIIAHFDKRHNDYFKEKRGCIGFFECIDNKDVSRALFNAAEKWLLDQAMEWVEGPLNFMVYDAPGILMDDYDAVPALQLGYSLPYYPGLYTDFGFEKSVDWNAYLFTKGFEIPKVYYKIRDRVLEAQGKEGLVLRNLNLKEYDSECKHIFKVFNKAWDKNWGHYPLTENQFQFFADELKQVINPELAMIADYGEKTAGFILSYVDVGPALKKANGRLYPFGLIKMFLAARKIKRLKTVLVGVIPEYRKRGLEVYFILETIERALKMKLEEADLSLIVETNSDMIKSLKHLGAKKYKTYRIMKKEVKSKESA